MWLLLSCSTHNVRVDDSFDVSVTNTSSISDLTASLSNSELSLKNSPTFRITAVGDIMLGTNFPFNHLPDNGITLLDNVSAIFKRAEISFGNLEGVLMDGGEPAKQCADLSHCYVFRSPSDYGQLLKNAGLTMLSLANNHSRDFGEDGRNATMKALDQHAILHSGVVDDIAELTLKRTKIAMIAFAPFRGVNDMLDMPLAAARVRQLSNHNNIVIVSMHGGAEGEDKSRLPFAKEFFYGEDRGDVVLFARTMVDSGADLVIGHGPHVPRAIELYRDRLIAYSLGNFCTYYGISVKGLRGLAPILDIELSQQGQFLNGMIHSFRQNRPNGPELDGTNESAKFIKARTLQDFPNGQLSISDSGLIKKIK